MDEQQKIGENHVTSLSIVACPMWGQSPSLAHLEDREMTLRTILIACLAWAFAAVSAAATQGTGRQHLRSLLESPESSLPKGSARFDCSFLEHPATDMLTGRVQGAGLFGFGLFLRRGLRERPGHSRRRCRLRQRRARGFDPSTVDFAHFGLFSIRERLRNLGGSMDIRSAPGQGTIVVVSAPLMGDDTP
jgi:hypothetical protein